MKNQTRPQTTIDPSMFAQLKEMLSNSLVLFLKILKIHFKPHPANNTVNYNVVNNNNNLEDNNSFKQESRYFCSILREIF